MVTAGPETATRTCGSCEVMPRATSAGRRWTIVTASLAKGASVGAGAAASIPASAALIWVRSAGGALISMPDLDTTVIRAAG